MEGRWMRKRKGGRERDSNTEVVKNFTAYFRRTDNPNQKGINKISRLTGILDQFLLFLCNTKSNCCRMNNVCISIWDVLYVRLQITSQNLVSESSFKCENIFLSIIEFNQMSTTKRNLKIYTNARRLSNTFLSEHFVIKEVIRKTLKMLLKQIKSE